MSITPVSLAGASAPAAIGPAVRSAGADGVQFANLFDRFMSSAAQSNSQAQAAVNNLALGKTDSLHDVMLQMAQADLSFRLILEIRNRLTEAYQEIVKMQI